jgi:hypothetical protein
MVNGTTVARGQRLATPLPLRLERAALSRFFRQRPRRDTKRFDGETVTEALMC